MVCSRDARGVAQRGDHGVGLNVWGQILACGFFCFLGVYSATSQRTIYPHWLGFSGRYLPVPSIRGTSSFLETSRVMIILTHFYIFQIYEALGHGKTLRFIHAYVVWGMRNTKQYNRPITLLIIRFSAQIVHVEKWRSTHVVTAPLSRLLEPQDNDTDPSLGSSSMPRHILPYSGTPVLSSEELWACCDWHRGAFHPCFIH